MFPLLAFTFLAAVKGGGGQVTPLNAVAAVGEEIDFQCSTNSTPDWIFSKDGTSRDELVITNDCIVSHDLRNQYRTEQHGENFTCNLIAFNITKEQAGVYKCTGTLTYYALLTVIDPSPSITPNNARDVMENENVTISCTLGYNGSVSPAPTLQPYFVWKNYDQQTVQSSLNSTTETSVRSEISVTIGRQDVLPYTCYVNLSLISSGAGGYPNNVPTVSISKSSPTFRVILTTLTTSTSTTTPSTTISTTPTTRISPQTTRTTTVAETVKTTTTTTRPLPQPTTTPTTTMATTSTTMVTTRTTSTTSKGSTMCQCGVTDNTSNGAATAMGVLFAFSLVANIALAALVIWFWKFKEPKKIVECRMTDLEEIQPTPDTYESLQKPEREDSSAIYTHLTKPVVFNPKTDIPKAIASKTATDEVEVLYVG